MTFDEYLSKIQYPVLATPKIDGIRCITADDIPLPPDKFCWAMTRSWKNVPNAHVRHQIETHLPPWLDGELTVGKNFQSATSGIMSYDSIPDFTYWVFDCDIISTLTYRQRVKNLNSIALPKFVRILSPREINSLDELLAYERECLAEEAEGIMIRPPGSLYNVGTSDNRGTFRYPYLVAIKRMDDGEAVIIGFNEAMQNTNPVEQNELGNNYRKVRADGMVPKDTLGSLRVRDLKTHVEFNVGSGFAELQRHDLWHARDKHSSCLGKIIKYKWQKCGTKDKPRIPIFLGFRDGKDMS